MSRKCTCLAPLVLVLVAVPAITHAQVVNLLEDPSFENEIIIGNTAWNRWLTWAAGGAVNSTVEIDRTEFIDGQKSLRVVPSGSGQFAVIYANLPLDVGERYTVSFWAKADAPRPVQVRLQAMNNSSMETADLQLTTEWAEYTFTAEATNASIKLQIQWDASVEVPYWLDFVSLYKGEYVAGIEPSGSSRVKAADPDPADGAADVRRDVVLGWTPGEFAATHDVYFGTVFGDVNDAGRANPRGVLASQGQIAATYDPPGRLDFGQTYYWRIDEVNAPPDSTIFKGDVWSFKVEPVGYPVAGDRITATASSQNSPSEGPEKTVDGSGLDESGGHSQDAADMWLSAASGPGTAWIRYDLDQAYKLAEMLVWNHNGGAEQIVGFGIKEAVIEYSADGNDFTALGTVELVRAASSMVDLQGVVAKTVRITPQSNWGGFFPQYGLSEVRFFSIPVFAREPSPASGATAVSVDAILSWRAGREAAKHDVYLSTGEQAVIDGTAPVATVTSPSFASSLDLASTYYWRIDEVNDVETPTTWQGSIWNLSTQEYLAADDFESYNDIPAGEEGSRLVYETWADGYANPTTNGSTMGYPTGASMETSTVYDGKLSVPLFYNNTAATRSEVTANAANLQAGTDWTMYGIKGLTLRFFGDPNNVPQQMYAKVNGAKVIYDGDAENLRFSGWQMWYIDLASLGVNLSNVTTLTIGFERIGAVGGQGMVLLDGIRLYSYDRQLITPTDPGTAGLQAQYQFEGNANDSSGNARNGTTQGEPAFAAGKVGQAISLDGFNDYVNIDGYKGILADAAGVQHAFTLSAWIKTAANGEIISWGTNAGGQRMTLRVDTVLRVEHGGGNIRGTNGPDLRDNQWHHVAATVPQGGRIMDVRLYVDGSDVTPGSTTAATFNLKADVDVKIGGGISGAGLFNGLIDDARIHDRVLSQEEIAWLSGRTMPFDKPF